MTTTRETSERAELLERARKWVVSMGLLSELNPDRVEAYVHGSLLLSEIAALRGENDRLAYECDGATLVNLELRATQAERQRDELREALEEHDRSAAECRIDGTRPQRDTSAPCDLCGATQRESCGRKGSAAYTLISTARTLLANHGADQ